MREIKFRQPVYNNDGTFSRWHYWGWMGEGHFVAPIHLSPRVKRERGQQFAGLLDKNGVEIYEGDKLECKYSIEYTDDYNEIDVAGDVTITGEVVLLRHEGWRLKNVTRTFEDDYDGKITTSNPRYCRIRPQKGAIKVIGNVMQHPEILDNQVGGDDG